MYVSNSIRTSNVLNRLEHVFPTIFGFCVFIITYYMCFSTYTLDSGLPYVVVDYPTLLLSCAGQNRV